MIKSSYLFNFWFLISAPERSNHVPRMDPHKNNVIMAFMNAFACHFVWPGRLYPDKKKG
jgi:hypothetical protein